MGLCKCPRKRMTNLFCFEHHVNVCEECLVHQHSKCVIKSYLNWLEDSDYDPNCSLCSRPFIEGECARLVCYHLYHWSCLNRHATQLPENTAPAGYKCPQCQQGIFPKNNMATPVADCLRKQLESTSWGRSGLGVPTSDQNGAGTGMIHFPPQTGATDGKTHNQETTISFEAGKELKSDPAGQEKFYEPVRRTTDGLNDYRPVSNSSKDRFPSEKESLLDSDHSDVKYRRKPLGEWFQRLIRAYIPRPSANDARAGMRRLFIAVLVILVVILTFGVFVTSVTRSSTFSESNLDEPKLIDPIPHDSRSIN